MRGSAVSRVRWRVSHGLRTFVLDPLGFASRVASGFKANQGFLLAGAVAYYSLLSIVPMVALILIALSQVVDQERLLVAAHELLQLIAADRSDVLMVQIASFLKDWKLIGVAGLVVLVFFSSLAFTVLENAMAMIFHHRVAVRRRHALLSAVLPYLYIVLMALGLLVVSFISAALHFAARQPVEVFGYVLHLGSAARWLLYLLGVSGEALLLTSLYLVMPVGRLAFRHALLGGVTAAVLWELTRHFLVWYFSTLSIVNVVYGSLASVIVILLSFEAAAIIVLLGAQVIAEFERTDTRRYPVGPVVSHGDDV